MGFLETWLDNAIGCGLGLIFALLFILFVIASFIRFCFQLQLPRTQNGGEARVMYFNSRYREIGCKSVMNWNWFGRNANFARRAYRARHDASVALQAAANMNMMFSHATNRFHLNDNEYGTLHENPGQLVKVVDGKLPKKPTGSPSESSENTSRSLLRANKEMECESTLSDLIKKCIMEHIYFDGENIVYENRQAGLERRENAGGSLIRLVDGELRKKLISHSSEKSVDTSRSLLRTNRLMESEGSLIDLIKASIMEHIYFDGENIVYEKRQVGPDRLVTVENEENAGSSTVCLVNGELRKRPISDSSENSVDTSRSSLRTIKEMESESSLSDLIRATIMEHIYRDSENAEHEARQVDPDRLVKVEKKENAGALCKKSISESSEKSVDTSQSSLRTNKAMTRGSTLSYIIGPSIMEDAHLDGENGEHETRQVSHSLRTNKVMTSGSTLSYIIRPSTMEDAHLDGENGDHETSQVTHSRKISTNVIGNTSDLPPMARVQDKQNEVGKHSSRLKKMSSIDSSRNDLSLVRIADHSSSAHESMNQNNIAGIIDGFSYEDFQRLTTYFKREHPDKEEEEDKSDCVIDEAELPVRNTLKDPKPLTNNEPLEKSRRYQRSKSFDMKHNMCNERMKRNKSFTGYERAERTTSSSNSSARSLKKDTKSKSSPIWKY